MTQLILLTSHFPYYPGEQFLEQEIAHFSDHFDWVVVVPIDLSQSDGTRRDLPDGVELVEMVRPDDSRVRSLASRLTTSFAEGIARAGLPHKTALDLRFSTTALGMYDRVSAALDDAGVSRSEPTITYGYWLFKQAAVATLLTRHHFTGRALAISRAHGADVYRDRGIMGYLPARRYLSRNLDHLYPISESGRREILAYPGIDAAKVEVARLGTNPPLERVDRARANPFHVVTVSHIIPLKRVDDIARAIAIAAKRVPGGIRWTHIGDSGKESLAKLDELTRDLGIDESTDLLGQISNAEVAQFYRENPVSFFVNFSTTEGVPVSIMEAFAHSIPAIATDVGGTGELVNSHNGELLPASATVEDLADELQRLASLSDEDYAAMSDNAFDTWQSMANGPENYEAFAHRLRDLI